MSQKTHVRSRGAPRKLTHTALHNAQNARRKKSGKTECGEQVMATYNDGYAEIAASDSAETGPRTLLNH